MDSRHHGANGNEAVPANAQNWLVSSAVLLIKLSGVLVAVLLLAKFWWPADLLINFRVQMAIGICGLVAIVLIGRNWLWLAIGICLLAVTSANMIPYLIPVGNAGRPQPSYRLLSSNVLTSNRQHEKLFELIGIEQPDFVLLMEIDESWAEAIEATLSDVYPFRLLRPEGHNFGIAILSKYPWDEIDVNRYEPLDLPWIQAIFELDGKRIQFNGVHPIPPMGESNSNHRNDEMLEVAAGVDLNTSRIIAGDFNMTPWSPWFKKVAQLSQTVDASRGFGVEPTWNAFPGIIGGLKIDHALMSEDLRVHDFRVGPDIGSDHRPIIVDFY